MDTEAAHRLLEPQVSSKQEPIFRCVGGCRIAEPGGGEGNSLADPPAAEALPHQQQKLLQQVVRILAAVAQAEAEKHLPVAPRVVGLEADVQIVAEGPVKACAFSQDGAQGG